MAVQTSRGIIVSPVFGFLPYSVSPYEMVCRTACYVNAGSIDRLIF